MEMSIAWCPIVYKIAENGMLLLLSVVLLLLLVLQYTCTVQLEVSATVLYDDDLSVLL